MYCFCRLYVSKLLIVHIFKLFYTFPLLPIHNLPSGMQGKSVSSAKISSIRDQPRFPQNAPVFAPPLSLHPAQPNAYKPLSKPSSFSSLEYVPSTTSNCYSSYNENNLHLMKAEFLFLDNLTHSKKKY